MCHIGGRDDFLPSSLLSFVILSISSFPDYMVSRHKCCLNSCSYMLHIDFFIGQFDRERILFDILLVCVFYMLGIRHKFVFLLPVYSDVVIKMK